MFLCYNPAALIVTVQPELVSVYRAARPVEKQNTLQDITIASHKALNPLIKALNPLIQNLGS